MTTARRIAVVQLAIWIVILAGLIFAVLAAGVTHFDEPQNQPRRLIIASLILVGLATNTVVIWLSRRARDHGDLDERDEAVARRASEFTLVGLAIAMFATSITLHTVYESQGQVPAAWLYIMAYGTLSLLSILHAAGTLLVDVTGQADA